MAAYYHALLSEFLADDPARVVGSLSSRSQHNELHRRQIKAWEREIELLKSASCDLISSTPLAAKWSLLLEYPIPRRRKRLDAVLLAADVIFCLEFKTEDKVHSVQSQRQVEDYALDLHDFHEASSDRRIVPIVIVPKAASSKRSSDQISVDAVSPVKLANAQDCAQIILSSFGAEHSDVCVPIDPSVWDKSPYRPVPTIIEAAEALYAGHDVGEIAHSHAGATNLTIHLIASLKLSSRRRGGPKKLSAS